MLKESEAFLGLGSNQGNKIKNLEMALSLLDEYSQIQVKRVSRFYFNKAIGLNEENPADFINIVCRIKTTLAPEELLEVCQEIENKLGRKRKPGLISSRTIDIDILFYDDLILKTDKLTIPHPEALKRNFVLIPFQEINAFIPPHLSR